MEENPSHRASRRGSPGASMGAEDGHGTPTQSTAAYGGTPYGYASGGYAQNAYVPFNQRQNQSHYGFQHAYYNPAMTPMRGAPHPHYGQHGYVSPETAMAGRSGHVSQAITPMQGASTMFRAAPFSQSNVGDGRSSGAAVASSAPSFFPAGGASPGHGLVAGGFGHGLPLPYGGGGGQEPRLPGFMAPTPAYAQAMQQQQISSQQLAPQGAEIPEAPALQRGAAEGGEGDPVGGGAADPND